LKLSLKQWIQVLLSLMLAVLIFWYLYKDISFETLAVALSETSMFWLFASIAVALIGFWIRAWRWKILINADSGQDTSNLNVFIALMIGYLVNLLVPRAGEVARCGVLVQTDKIPIGKSFGTVILERTLDFVFFLSIIFIGFLVESRVFLNLIREVISLEYLLEKSFSILPAVLGGGAIFILFVYIIFRRYQDNNFLNKIRHFIRDVISGIVSLRKVKNQFGFWGSSILIWFSYYLTMVMVALAIPSTASLSLSAVLIVMVMGSIGMIAPVQGGIGTFHALVAFILMVYGLSEEEGKIFAAIIHGSQMLTIIAVGLVCVGIYFKIISSKASKSV
jgi:glycosyltransferase 2 family protein